MSLLLSLLITGVVLLLFTGIYSLVVTRNLMRILISVEILSKAVTLMMITAGYVTGNIAVAEAYVITIIILEVVLLVVLTGILLGAFRANGTLDTRKLNNLKG